MINWYKSRAIWLYDESHPAWHPHPNFMWINQGESTKYLGFQIGFNIFSEMMVAPVIHSIRQKLIHLEKTLTIRSCHSGKSGIRRNDIVQPIMLYNLQGRYTLDSTTVRNYIGLVRKIMQLGTRWRGMCSHHPSGEEDWF